MKSFLHPRLIPAALALLLPGLLTWSSAPALAKNLTTVPLVRQVTVDAHNNPIGTYWCWAACSKMVLDYYGYPQALTAIVTYGVSNADYDTTNSMWGTTPERRTIDIWQEVINRGVPTGIYKQQPKTVAYTSRGMVEIIDHFSNGEVQTQKHYGPLVLNDARKEIDDNDAPFVIRLRWTHPTTGDDLGGHVIVCYGVNGDVLSIHDPGLGDYMRSHSVLLNGSGITRNNHTWTHTLTTSKLLDVVFLFDTTGSMSSSISSAKANALTLLDNISNKFKGYRVAVADYKDFPQSPYGDSGDYVYRAVRAFTSDKAAVQAAINGLTTGGGNDTPESVYSALSSTLAGSGLSDGTVAWRDNPAKRIIILIADAPGHDPEPWAGGLSFAQVKNAALNPAKPISVHSLWVGSNINAGTNFNQISGATGGSVVNTSGSGVGAALQAIVDSVADDPRSPQGSTSSIYPAFIFEPFASTMGAPVRATFLEIQKQNPRTEQYARFRIVSLRDTDATLYEATMPFPQGHYRWRVGYRRPATRLYLPASDTTTVEPARTAFETEFTEFERLPSVPGAVTIIAPDSGEYAQSAVEYSFGTVPGASRYRIEIFAEGRKWRTLTVRPPAADPDAAVLKVLVRGHRPGVGYHWRVQALNFDRRTPDDAAWTTSGF